ncbi:hypothetical protein D3C84_817330 [compost metagenome]
MVGIEVDEDQVRRLGAVQQLHGIPDTHIEARVVAETEVLHGQARHVRAQLDHLDVFQRQELQAGLGQGAGTQAEEQRVFRRFVAERTQQHGAGVVVLQPGGIGAEHAALLHRLAELEDAVRADLVDPDHAEIIMHFREQALLGHHVSTLSMPMPDGKHQPGATAAPIVIEAGARAPGTIRRLRPPAKTAQG